MALFNGFVGPAYEAYSIYQDAQECINWYLEVDPNKGDGDRGKWSLYPTPGLIQKIQFPNEDEVRQLYPLPGGLYALGVCGNSLYLINSDLIPTFVGNLYTSTGIVSITDNRVEAYIVDGPNRYSYNISTGVLSVISSTDGAFQGGVKCGYIDDFIFYSRPNSNQWAATSPLSSVTPALSFSSKDSSSDNIVTTIEDHREAVIIGERTTERWINTGAFPFPFERIPGATIQHGCVAANSIARFGESIAWLSKDSRGATIVIQMNGYVPQRISTHAVENDIANGVINDAIAFTYQQNGHEFYMLTFPAQNKTWTYDIATQQWHKRAYRNNLNQLERHRANCQMFFQGMNLVGDYENGIIYQLDLNTFTDNEQPIIRIRRTPHLTNGLNRMTYDFLQIQFQPGIGLPLGQGSDPMVMLRWSDDGGSTYSNYHEIPIGKIGKYKNRAIKRQMGWGRDRIYEASITDPVKAVIISAELDTTDSDD